jgi:hypothetical protein
VPEPGAFEVEMRIANQKRHKSPSTDQIPAELITARGRKIGYDIHKLIHSIWNKEELPEKWKETVIVPVYKKGNKTDCSNCRGLSFCQLLTKFYPTSCCQG